MADDNALTTHFAELLCSDLEDMVIDGRGEDVARLLKSILERTGLGRADPEFRRQVVALAGDFADANQQNRNGITVAAERTADLRARVLSSIEKLEQALQRSGLDGGASRSLLDQVEAVKVRNQQKPVAPEGRIFISYRRDSSADIAGRIHDYLVQRFGAKTVFMDVHDIPIGADFRAHIVGVLARCSAVLAIIGPDWTQARDATGQLRLRDENDLLRIEIEVAIALGSAVVVPIFVGGATGIAREDIPDTLRSLATREGHTVGRDPNFHTDMEKLVDRLQNRLR